MSKSRRVLSNRNGAWNAQVLFVAEAPGRLGAEVTGIPLWGDRTGARFEELLGAMGWHRHGIFITNAALCNPRDAAGNNSTPTRQEIVNCSCWLRRTIEIVDPVVVVALGRVALEGLKLVASHNLKLKLSAGRVFSWNKRMLGVLYHPGPRTVIHRSWKRQLTDARKLAARSSRFLSNVPLEKLDFRKRSEVLAFPGEG
jgi:uracil-DNA glycosylase family 4